MSLRFFSYFKGRTLASMKRLEVNPPPPPPHPRKTSQMNGNLVTVFAGQNFYDKTFTNQVYCCEASIAVHYLRSHTGALELELPVLDAKEF